MKIEHIALFVNDLEAAKDFFVKYLNGKPGALYHNASDDFMSYFIEFDDGARLEIMKKPGVLTVDNEQEKTGYSHLAFSVGSREKVDELTSLLVQDGYRVLRGPRTTGDGYYESCIVAIESNPIEITV